MISDPITPAEQAEANLFYESLGRAIGRWSTLEYYLGLMFQRATNMEHPVARSIFHSARSWRAKYDMLAATLAVSDSRPGVVESWQRILETANKYAAFRNVLAHDHVQLSGRDRKRNLRLLVIRSPRADYMTPEKDVFYHRNHLENAAENFGLLGALVTQAMAHPQDDQLGSPERLTWLADQMPNPPHSGKVAPKIAAMFELGLQRQAFPH